MILGEVGQGVGSIKIDNILKPSCQWENKLDWWFLMFKIICVSNNNLEDDRHRTKCVVGRVDSIFGSFV